MCNDCRGLYPTEATIVVTRVVCDANAFTILAKIVENGQTTMSCTL